MNTRIHFCAVAVLALLECGCMTTVTHRSPFNGYVGKALKTQRTTILYYDDAYESNADIFSPPKPALFLRDAPSAYANSKKRVATFPAGQKVRLLAVREEPGDGSVSYTAIGEIYVPAWKRYVTFYHQWGSNDELYRAPWDSSAVPAVRRL
jgi:hypothetical protein